MELEFEISFDREEDGRWIAEIRSLPGALVYGSTRDEARRKVEALALRIVADRIQAEQTVVEQIRFFVAST